MRDFEDIERTNPDMPLSFDSLDEHDAYYRWLRENAAVPFGATERPIRVTVALNGNRTAYFERTSQ